MPSGPTSKAASDHELQSPGLSREEIAEPAREPLEDHSGSSWGAWGRDQLTDNGEEEPLVDALSVAGSDQRQVRSEAANGAASPGLPSQLQNPTARDVRMETHETEEARMATEPPEAAP